MPQTATYRCVVFIPFQDFTGRRPCRCRYRATSLVGIASSGSQVVCIVGKLYHLTKNSFFPSGRVLSSFTWSITYSTSSPSSGTTALRLRDSVPTDFYFARAMSRDVGVAISRISFVASFAARCVLRRRDVCTSSVCGPAGVKSIVALDGAMVSCVLPATDRPDCAAAVASELAAVLSCADVVRAWASFSLGGTVPPVIRFSSVGPGGTSSEEVLSCIDGT